MIDLVVAAYQQTGADYVSNVQPPTFPDGLDVEVFRFSALLRAWREAGAARPRGVVSLDSGALDVPLTMKKPPLPRIYDAAFGRNPADWIAASPYHQLTRDAVPMLFVCSSRRQDACPQGRAMAEKAKTLGVAMEVLPEDLSHGEVNHLLGAPSAYTEAVDTFVQRHLN